MKAILLSTLVLSLGISAARAAENAPATDAHTHAPALVRSETRTIEITGLNGRTTIVLRDAGTPAHQQAPYALQGSGTVQPTSAPGQGYQAR